MFSALNLPPRGPILDKQRIDLMLKATGAVPPPTTDANGAPKQPRKKPSPALDMDRVLGTGVEQYQGALTKSGKRTGGNGAGDTPPSAAEPGMRKRSTPRPKKVDTVIALDVGEDEDEEEDEDEDEDEEDSREKPGAFEDEDVMQGADDADAAALRKADAATLRNADEEEEEEDPDDFEFVVPDGDASSDDASSDSGSGSSSESASSSDSDSSDDTDNHAASKPRSKKEKKKQKKIQRLQRKADALARKLKKIKHTGGDGEKKAAKQKEQKKQQPPPPPTSAPPKAAPASSARKLKQRSAPIPAEVEIFDDVAPDSDPMDVEPVAEPLPLPLPPTPQPQQQKKKPATPRKARPPAAAVASDPAPTSPLLSPSAATPRRFKFSLSTSGASQVPPPPASSSPPPPTPAPVPIAHCSQATVAAVVRAHRVSAKLPDVPLLDEADQDYIDTVLSMAAANADVEKSVYKKLMPRIQTGKLLAGGTSHHKRLASTFNDVAARLQTAELHAAGRAALRAYRAPAH